MSNVSNSPVDVFDRVTLSIGKLYSVGGISLVLSGVATAMLVMTIILSATGVDVVGQLGPNSTLFLASTLVIGVAGACIGGLERFGEYRLAARRLDMMITLTEILVRSAATGQKADRLTPEGMDHIVRNAYSAVLRNSTLAISKEDQAA